MKHPAFEQAREVIRKRQETAEGRARGGVVIMNHNDMQPEDGQRPPINFYLQSRAFADFMIEKSGDRRIFADIAKFIADGSTIEGWLKDNGQKIGVATTVAGLDTQFKNWLTAE